MEIWRSAIVAFLLNTTDKKETNHNVFLRKGCVLRKSIENIPNFFFPLRNQTFLIFVISQLLDILEDTTRNEETGGLQDFYFFTRTVFLAFINQKDMT